MSKKVSLALILGILLVLLLAGVAQAQEVRGSIRGNVYEDRNGDGQCGGANDLPAAGIPIEFTSSDGQHTLFLQSGDEGSYGLVAAGLGTWTVTIRPPENFVATSQPAIQVTLTPEVRVVTGVNFCVRQRGAPGGGPPSGGPPGGPGGPGYGGGPGGPPPGYHPPVLLPESGAAAQSTGVANAGLMVAGLVGFLFVGLGVVVAAHNRMQPVTNQDS